MDSGVVKLPQHTTLRVKDAAWRSACFALDAERDVE